MSKHTPGTWEVRPDPDYADRYWLTATFGYDWETSGEIEANARLMTAAPELLAFVERQFQNTACICKFDAIQAAMGTSVKCTHCEAGALIAKAEGVK